MGASPTLSQNIEFECIFKFEENYKPKVFSINKYGELNKEYSIVGNQKKWILKSDENNPPLNLYIIRNIKNESNLKYIALITIFSIVFVIIILFIIFYFIKRRRKRKNIEIGLLESIR